MTISLGLYRGVSQAAPRPGTVDPAAEGESEQATPPGDNATSSQPPEDSPSPVSLETPTEPIEGILPSDLMGSVPIAPIVMALSLVVVMLSFCHGSRRIDMLSALGHGVWRVSSPRPSRRPPSGRRQTSRPRRPTGIAFEIASFSLGVPADPR